MKYFFILGSNPTLSAAELSAFFGADGDAMGAMALKSGVLIFSAKKRIEAAAVIDKLGGTIKIGEIMDSIPFARPEDALPKIIPALTASGGKYKFGISRYGRQRADIKKLAMAIKDHLRARGVNSRWVTSRDAALSSVVVTQNKLLEQGMEIVLIADGGKFLLGRTLAVQPFKELSARDYGRPARDDASGMLPPKLAMIMINLARVKPDGVILDPFCGSGTILTEAMLMGYKNLIGADISEKAAEDTKKNIAWIKEKLRVSSVECRVTSADAAHLSQNVRPQSVDAIITEPYLGPQRGGFDAGRTVAELEKLYADALQEFKKILKPGGRVVMIWPVFMNHEARNTKHETGEMIAVNQDLHGFKIVNPVPEKLAADPAIKLTDRKTIIYGRPGQRVWREIVVMK
jgi:tRNA G10  N-methylase Trm11